ncbi:hypothetical protein BDV38DRAFT_235321 [Aspergillus pseudotamarii]|uniref:Uncharacterized protein n=1 Tax=Aspergillus pseudotamarii TaxID=132259 RepID=A0A5N6T8N0_ASPPS|nr:uncharacterized protein BDV38DRAFT_235321 [Aspergillus pseudotamarii]KAE8142617.1 hypothetical protein BDV38DRAFT_235321 [Aspergillus pseudotamarii]
MTSKRKFAPRVTLYTLPDNRGPSVYTTPHCPQAGQILLLSISHTLIQVVSLALYRIFWWVESEYTGSVKYSLQCFS